MNDEGKSIFVLEQAKLLLEHKISSYDQIFNKASALLTVCLGFVAGSIGYAISTFNTLGGLCNQSLIWHFAILYAILIGRAVLRLQRAITTKDIYGLGDAPSKLLAPSVYNYPLPEIIKAEAMNYEARINMNSKAVDEASEEYETALRRFAWAPFIILIIFAITMALIWLDLGNMWPSGWLSKWCA